MNPSPPNEAAGKVLSRILGRQPQELPTLPASAWEITRLAQGEDTTIEDMVRAIAKDPPLAAKVLQVANSPVFRVRAGGELTELNRAMVIMGFEQVSSLALGLKIISALGGGKPLKERLQLLNLWRHSVAVGVLAEILSKDFLGWKSGCYVYGLVHDIGKIALHAFRSDDYAQVLVLQEKEHMDSLRAENQIMRVDHCFLGKVLFMYWGLTPSMIAAAAEHHQPWEAGEHQDLAGLVCLADILVNAMGIGSHAVVKRPLALPELEPQMAEFLAQRHWSPAEFIAGGLEEKFQQALEGADHDL